MVNPLFNEARASGVSWPAVLGGAFVSAALSLILVALGAGFGLAAVSPWSSEGASATALGIGAAIWLVVMQIVSSGAGGYLAGRLRTRWVDVHTDEVYFRDTAHGFLSWAVSLVVTAGFLTAAAAQMAGAAGAAAASTSKSDRDAMSAGNYYVDTLFRPAVGRTDTASNATRAEANIILMKSLKDGAVASHDRGYLTQVITANTGVAGGEADARITSAFTDAQTAADTARKAASRGLLWAFLALLIGAFTASFAATTGGRQRDRVKTA